MQHPHTERRRGTRSVAHCDRRVCRLLAIASKSPGFFKKTTLAHEARAWMERSLRLRLANKPMTRPDDIPSVPPLPESGTTRGLPLAPQGETQGAPAGAPDRPGRDDLPRSEAVFSPCCPVCGADDGECTCGCEVCEARVKTRPAAELPYGAAEREQLCEACIDELVCEECGGSGRTGDRFGGEPESRSESRSEDCSRCLGTGRANPW